MAKEVLKFRGELGDVYIQENLQGLYTVEVYWWSDDYCKVIIETRDRMQLCEDSSQMAA